MEYVLERLELEPKLTSEIENVLRGVDNPVSKWESVKKILVKNKVSFDKHLALYKMIYSNWDYKKGPCPAWVPNREYIDKTNIGKLMKELGISDYREFHRWSSQNRKEFWRMMIEKIGIIFKQPPQKIFEGTPREPKWLEGAKMNIVDSCFKADKKKTAIIYKKGKDTKKITYEQLEKLVNRVSNGLGELGLKPGDSVAIDMSMNYECVAIYLGVVKAGCVVVSISESFASDQIEMRVKLGKAKLVFTQDYNILKEDKKIEIYSKVLQSNAPKCVVLFYEKEDKSILRKEDLTFNDFLSDNDAFESVSRKANDHMNILFSSGTTAEPKAIPWTHTTPIKSAVDGYLHQNIKSDSVVCWPTSIGWMMGPWLIYAGFINNATIVLNTISSTSREFCEFVEESGITVLGLVPSVVKAWRVENVPNGLDWSKIELFSSTGECSNEEDYLYLMSLAGYKPVIEYLGGTEIGGGHITGTVVQPASPATFTSPALGLDLILLNEAGKETDRGELFIIPPSIGLSTELLNKDHYKSYYEGCPDFNGVVLRRHGDEIEKLSNSYYRAHGRVDDCMNLGGAKTSSQEIERAIQSLPYIYDVAAVAINPDDGGPSNLVVYIVLSQYKSKDVLKKEIQGVIKKFLNPLYRVYDVVIVNSLPRTASNKVMRRVLRNEYTKSCNN